MFDLYSTGFFAALVRTSIQAGVVAVLVLLAQWVFGVRLSARWRCNLWGLVAIRLLLPVSFGSGASLFNLWPREASPKIELGSSGPRDQVLVDRGQRAQIAEPQLDFSPTTNQTHPIAENVLPLPALKRVPAPQTPAVLRSPSEAAGAVRHPVSIAEAVFGVWISISGMLLIYVGLATARACHRLNQLTPLEDGRVLEVLSKCAKMMNVRMPLLVESDHMDGPAVFGLIRPRVLLPRGFAAGRSFRELEFIFLHELAHVRRLDLAAHWLGSALIVLHWFNPVLWLAFARWRADRELACDAMAIEASGPASNIDYGKTLLELWAAPMRSRIAPGIIGILENRTQLRRRIQAIAAMGPSRRSPLIAAIIIIGIALTGLTDPQKTGQELPARTAENPSVPPAPVEPDEFPGAARQKLRVRVIDSATGQPLEGVDLYGRHETGFFGGRTNAPHWRTGKDGAAILARDIPSTWFPISARLRGYAPRGIAWPDDPPVGQGGVLETTFSLDHGQSVGGVVVDEAGRPLGGVRVRLYGSGYDYRSTVRTKPYSEFWNGDPGSPVTFTDAEGRWSIPDFPGDLENVEIDLARPDGSSRHFRHDFLRRNPSSYLDGEPVSMKDLRAGVARFVLRPGLPIRGQVVDPTGKPLPHTPVKEAYGAHNMLIASQFETDGNGRFDLRNRLPRQMILTAAPKDFAVTSVIVDVKPDAPEVRLEVAPRRPLAIHAEDGDGRPIAGAKIQLAGFGTEGQALDFEAKTDNAGNAEWAAAPNSAYTLAIYSPPNHSLPSQIVRVEPGQHSVRFRLRRGMDEAIVLHGKTIDSETRTPIRAKRMGLQFITSLDYIPLEDPTNSDFTVAISLEDYLKGSLPSFRLRIDATGYAPVIAERCFWEGDWDATFAMVRSEPPGGTVVLPDGSPASYAEIAVQTSPHRPMALNGSGHALDVRGQSLSADRQGRFTVRDPGVDGAVLLTHERGFLATTVAKLRSRPRLTLAPWGSIEGIYRIGDKPQPYASLQLCSGMAAPPGWFASVPAITDAEGRFVFDRVPAGDYIISRSIPQRKGVGTGGPSHQTVIAVKAGETFKMDFGGGGRRIVGRLEAGYDWAASRQVLTLKRPYMSPFPHVEDYATRAAFDQARDGVFAERRRKHERDWRCYPLEFSPDGAFKIEDVVPGTYELTLRLLKPGQDQSFNYSEPDYEPLCYASLVRDVVVSAGKPGEPLDLGFLQPEWTERPPVEGR